MNQLGPRINLICSTKNMSASICSFAFVISLWAVCLWFIDVCNLCWVLSCDRDATPPWYGSLRYPRILTYTYIYCIRYCITNILCGAAWAYYHVIVNSNVKKQYPNDIASSYWLHEANHPNVSYAWWMMVAPRDEAGNQCCCCSVAYNCRYKLK